MQETEQLNITAFQKKINEIEQFVWTKYFAKEKIQFSKLLKILNEEYIRTIKNTSKKHILYNEGEVRITELSAFKDSFETIEQNEELRNKLSKVDPNTSISFPNF